MFRRVDMNVFAKFDEISSMSLQDIKDTKLSGWKDRRTHGRSVGQRENSMPTHKHGLGGVKYKFMA